MGMLISNFSSGGILGSYIDCISVFSTKNYKAFLSMLRDSSSPEKYICACLKYLLSTSEKLLYNWNSNLHLVQLGTSIQLHLFHCLQTVSLLAGFTVQLEPMSSKAMSTLGTEELGTRNSEQGDTFNSYFNQKQLKYINDQHKSVSRVDRAQIKISLPLFKKEKRNKQKNITHTHTNWDVGH